MLLSVHFSYHLNEGECVLGVIEKEERKKCDETPGERKLFLFCMELVWKGVSREKCRASLLALLSQQ